MDDDTLDEPYSRGMTFALWLTCLFGLFGIHRFYLGKPVTGILYLLTGGLFVIGQVVDLIRLTGMVAAENHKAAAFRALDEKRALRAMQRRQLPAPAAAKQLPAATPESFRIQLVKAAARYRGTLTVTQGVLATGKSFEEVEAELDAMARSGYVGIDNDPRTGAVIYTFGELDADG